MLLHCNNGCTNAPQCYILHTIAYLVFSNLQNAAFSSAGTLRMRTIHRLLACQSSALFLPLSHHGGLLAEHRVQTSTWPVGVHSLQAAIWLPLRSVQDSTVIAAVCSILVTKASQSITQLCLFNECLAVA
jgi:hypothetical protein